MKDTCQIGNVTQGMVLAALLISGRKVLTPFGDGLPYDLLIDNNGQFIRVQCKTGLLKKGSVEFRNYTVLRGGSRRTYNESADAFGVYCPQTKQAYLVPISGCGQMTTSLRIDKPKNNMVKGVRWAKDFEIRAVVA
jgi:hypothetical protein